MLAGMDTSGMNHMTPTEPRPGRSVWAIIGTTLAVLLTIGGLALVGFAVVIYVGLSYWGSNK